MKVLFFESDPVFASEVQRAFARRGDSVRVAHDASAGLRMAGEDRPDLILLCVELPRMNGFSVSNKIKRDPNIKDVPLVILSSEITQETIEQHKLLRTRADCYVRKPIAAEELVAVIERDVGLPSAVDLVNEAASSFDDDIVIGDLEEPVERAEPQPGAGEKDAPLEKRPPVEEEARRRVVASLTKIDRLPPRHDSLTTPMLLSIDSMYPELLEASTDEAREMCIRDAFPNDKQLRTGLLSLIELLDPTIDVNDPIVKDADADSLVKVVLFEERHRYEMQHPSAQPAPVAFPMPPATPGRKSIALPPLPPSHRQTAAIPASREFLELREQLNKKDHEVVELQDRLQRHLDLWNDLQAELDGATETAQTLRSELEKSRAEAKLQSERVKILETSLTGKNKQVEELHTELTVDPSIEPLAETPTSAPTTLEVQLRAGTDGRICVRCGGDWTPGVSLGLTDAVLRRVRSGAALVTDVESVGERLFDALQASPEFTASYRKQLALATDRSPLRLVLSMLPDVDDAGRTSVAEHCWETLRDRETERQLGVALDVRLIRSSAVAQAAPAADFEGAFRLVVGFASPTITEEGAVLPTLSLMNELQAFKEVEGLISTSSRVDLQVVNRLGMDNFSDFVRGAHMLHYSGHGDSGKLRLQSSDMESQLLDAAAFAEALANPLPFAITLNCCRSVGSDSRGKPLPVALLSRGVPMVVAMAGDLADATALKFAREFYTRVLAGEDIEAAVQKARWRLYAERSRLDWFFPTLWTNLYAMFAPLAASHGANFALPDRRIRQRVQVLNAEVAVLRPRVAVIERLERVPATERLSDADREVMTSVLTRELEKSAGSIPDRIEAIFADARRVEELAQGLSKGASQGAAERVITSMERSILPQLGELVSLLPRVLEAATESTTSSGTGDDTSWLEAAGDPLDDEPLALDGEDGRGKLREYVARVLAELALPEQVIHRALVNLLAGRHLVLIGPPGTGKSTIAQKLSAALGYDSLLVTANPEWSTFEVIGGMVPVAQRDRKGAVSVSYAVRPGCVVEAVKRNWTLVSDPPRWQRTRSADVKGTWLVIDEMNRAPMDHAFGDLFTALVTRKLRVPRVATALDAAATSTVPIPLDFRLICTANTADRHLLFEMSEALKRRFAFIEVPAYFTDNRSIPDNYLERIVEQLVKRPNLVALKIANLDQRLRDCLRTINPILGRIRAVHPLGTAQAIDAVVSGVVESSYDNPERAEEFVREALVEQVVPVLEGLPRELLLLLVSLLDGTLHKYLDGMATQRDAFGDELTESMRSTLAELANYLEGVDPDHWKASTGVLRHAVANGGRLDQLVASLPEHSGVLGALPAAAPLTRALRRISRTA